MNKRIFSLMLMYLLSFSFIGLSVISIEAVPGTIRVPQDFLTIQEAINASEPGGIILVAPGTYHENVTVWKPLTIEGENRESTIVDQAGAFAVFHVTADNVIISGFTIRSASVGIWMDNSHHSTITSNVITNNDDGIWVTFSNSNAISDNIITSNVFFGLYLKASNDTTSNGNTLTENTFGIYMENCENGSIYENTIALNYGDGLYMGYSDGNAIFHNAICNNSFGIYLEGSNANSIYENDLLDNISQASAENITINTWDNGSRGNYWSDYNGTDLNHDGIGDTPYIINANNTDRYPLMNHIMFHDIAITNVVASKTVVGQGFALNMDLNVQNQGNFTETFTITLCLNATVIDMRNVTLVAGATQTIIFVWIVPSNFTKGSYTLNATSDTVLCEFDTVDNTYTNGVVAIAMAGDINADGIVDVFDLVIVAAQFGRPIDPPLPITDLRADVNGDGVADIFDLVIIAANFGKTDP